MHFTLDKALQKIDQGSETAVELFRHGSLLLEIYKPEKIDKQSPHERDELYVISSGSGEFINGDVQHPVNVGDVLFVAAGVEHRFVNFTDDFSTWVFFYGPDGGEANS